MKNASKFWHHTPPAIFPCILGFLGLGVAWRKAAEIWPLPAWLGECILTIAASLFLIAFASYVAKLLIRPSVLIDDLKVLPARGAVVAGVMCLMVLAIGFIPYNIEIAKAIWWISIALQTICACCVIYAISQSKNSLANVTPTLILPFVGYIVAAISGPSLGYIELSKMFLIGTSPFYVLITVISLLNLKPKTMLPPVRTSYVILLAPTSIYGIAGLDLWGLGFFEVFWWAALIVLIVMLPAIRWFTAGGWNPGWGAFTFPLTAFVSVMMLGVEAGYGSIATIASVSGL